MQRTPSGGTTSYDFVANATAGDADWVRLLGSYTVPSDSSQLQLYLESPAATASYDLDDVTITMTSPPPGGPRRRGRSGGRLRGRHRRGLDATDQL